jgi:hypothetical protein
MDYKKHYTKLIERAKVREISSHTETHHIIPRCMGGDDSFENLVKLTPEEHYVAHQLLVKIYPHNRKLIFAMNMMCTAGSKAIRSNKKYGWVKRKVAVAIREMRTGKKDSEEARQKKSVSRRKRVGDFSGWKQTIEARKKISAALKGDKNPMFGKTHSEEARKKIGQASVGRKPNLGVKWSEQTIEKLRIAARNRSKIECPHCKKLSTAGNFARWHGDKCKYKENTHE